MYAEKIKRLRLKMLLTQVEFAKELNVSFESVNRWENNKNEPTMKIKRKLEKYFDEWGIADHVVEK